MKIQLFPCATIFTVALSCSACVYKVVAPAQLYAPPMSPVPMLEKKGDLKISGGVSYSGDQGNGDDEFLNLVTIGLFPDTKILDDIFTFSGSGTYALGNHFALNGNVMGGAASRTYDFIYFDGSTEAKPFERRYSYLDGELALGTYWAEARGKGQIRGGLFAGAGGGNSDLSAHLNRRNSRSGIVVQDVLGQHQTNYRKFFAQSYFGYVQKHIEVGALLKLTNLHYELRETRVGNDVYAASTSKNTLLEPGLFFAVGSENTKIRFQYQRMIPFGHLDFPANDNYYSLGLDMKFGKNATQKTDRP